MKPQYKEIEAKFDKTIAALENEYSSIRAGRANTAVLDKLSVDYYGAPTKINQLASLSIQEARILVVQPYDSSVLKEIEKAILASDIGINPQNDGKVLRLTFPPLTEERRKDLCKQIQKEAENAKVAIRSIRRDALEVYKAQKKKSEITEDDLKVCEKDIQDATDKYCKDIDDISKKKEAEIMEI
ncbi:MAG: ribosome recycling factor [Ruminococcaceae bacterium]|nr:ribosome recycling factor [Oscillospiraceae bacterium]